MNTPIADFVRAYAASGCARLHMPGHKGRPFLGCEALDVTEIAGADELYGAAGIIAQSEKNAGALFGSGRTFYAAEGSSQCVRAMLALAVWSAPPGRRPVVLAARNAHKSLLYAAALLDFDVAWLWPESPGQSLCACPVSPAALERALEETRPAAVYVTSPDYLGGTCDVAALAEVSHRRGVPLLVDNAHGAYLRFLSPSRHPMDLGADLCCDSAHKTLPVLTGGAYLHVGRGAPAFFGENGRRALALFGSTSPSYLILQSLDLCNQYLAGDYPRRLAETAGALAALRERLRGRGWGGICRPICGPEGWSASTGTGTIWCACGRRRTRQRTLSGSWTAWGRTTDRPGPVRPCPRPGGRRCAPSGRPCSGPGRPCPPRRPWAGCAVRPRWPVRRRCPSPWPGSASARRRRRCSPGTAWTGWRCWPSSP